MHENFEAPEFRKDAFHCPICGAFAHMDWELLYAHQRGSTLYYETYCSRCDTGSLWRVTSARNTMNGRLDDEAEMVFPDSGSSPLPEPDMPSDVLADYMEASQVFARSPRAAAALLRLALQKLCVHLGQEGKNINTDIRSLAESNVLPPAVIKVSDTVRLTGNNAVHPGEMSPEDIDHIASKMFGLLNFVVRKGISEPAEIEALYKMTPEGPRNAAESKDAAAKTKST